MQNTLRKVLYGVALAGAVVLVFCLILFLSTSTQRQRSQLNACIGNMRILDSAKEQYAMDHGLKDGEVVPQDGIRKYLKGTIYCPTAGKNAYTLGVMGVDPSCSLHGTMSDPHFPNGMKLRDSNK